MFGYTLATLLTYILSKRWLGNLHPHSSIEESKFELLAFCCLSCFKVFEEKPKDKREGPHTLVPFSVGFFIGGTHSLAPGSK